MKAEPFLLDFAKMSIDFQMFVLALNLLFEYQRLWLINVLSPEQELAIQIADVDRVEINDSNLGETTQRQALDQFTTDSTSAYHKQFGCLDQLGSLLRIHQLQLVQFLVLLNF